MCKIKCLLATACIVFMNGVAPAFAAKVNVVHGINGLDVGAARELPVDIAVNGSCALKGVQFTQSAVVELAPARYLITIHPADGSCSQSPLISKRVTIAKDESIYSAVASLSERGKPQLKLFGVTRNDGALFIQTRHLAKASPVTIKIASPYYGSPLLTTVKNGGVARAIVFQREFPFTANVISKGTKRSLARFSGLFKAGRYEIYNVVGSRTNGLTIIRERF